jgi:hypothetical protein
LHSICRYAMNRHVTEPTGTPRQLRRIPLVRWSGLGGIAYVVLFVVGTAVAHGGAPDTGGPPAKIIHYFSSGSHRDKVALGCFLGMLGVFFFLWFLAALRQAVRRLAGDGILGMLVTIGGGVYAALTLVAFAVDVAVKTMSDDTYHHQVYPGLIHAADDAWYVLHSTGGVGAAAMMIAASLACLASSKVPRWLAWLGVVAGITAIVSFFFVPWFIIAVWLVVASILVVRAHVEEDATF